LTGEWLSQNSAAEVHFANLFRGLIEQPWNTIVEE
jgi:hypothetical protein